MGGISPAYPPHTAERERGPGASPSPSPGKPERKTRSGQLITSRSGSAICVGVESRCEPVLWPEAASCPRSFHFWVKDEAVVIHKRRGKPQRAQERGMGAGAQPWPSWTPETDSGVQLGQAWAPAPFPCPLAGDSGHGHPGFLCEDAETPSSQGFLCLSLTSTFRRVSKAQTPPDQ